MEQTNQNRLRAQERLVRKLVAFSQHQIATPSQIRRSRLSDWEQGHVDLRSDECERLRAALRDAIEARMLELDDAENALGKVK